MNPMTKNNYPQFPLYIPSKGRYEYLMTSHALTEMGIKHNIVVEPQEVEKYENAIKVKKLLTRVIPLDMNYKTKYELCDSFGLKKSTGSGPARNFIWDHSISEGHKWHWIMDDNIREFWRMTKNKRIRTNNPAFWKAMEDFVLRYSNVSMAGPSYSMFGFGPKEPFCINTRIYSCNLIRNDVPFRWRGRYNEDTILSLDMLKQGWCTIQFYTFLQGKIATQSMKGGNTDELYKGGTREKSEMLVKEHPDVSKVVIRYGRWHHFVDYRPFKKTKLLKKKNIVIAKKNNNYGMKLVTLVQ